MVLTRRWGVLGVALCAVLSFVWLAGCNQSLFDAHGAGGGGGGDGGMVPSSCPTPCLADAAGDFDGTPGGKTMLWRYLDDHRDRTWTAMTGNATAMTGADPGNVITTCAARPTAPACKVLPGALLVSSAGATSKADPALELTATKNQVLQLSIHAFVPSGDDQTIRIYRNSREDVLFTGLALAGVTLDQAVTFDAIAGDRFLVAVAPTAKGATDVGLQVFVSPTGANFPSACQVAIPFTAATGNAAHNVCGTDFTHSQYNDTGADTDTPPVLAPGPFLELGNAASLTAVADLSANTYFKGASRLDKSHDITVQFWVKVRNFVPGGDAWVFSDIDFDDPPPGSPVTLGGLGIVIVNSSSPVLDVQTCTGVTMTTLDVADASTPYPNDHSWQFVRITHTNGNVNICLNGVRKTNFPVVAGHLQSGYEPYLGMNVIWGPRGPYFDGELDDVRVLTGALPCDP